MKKLLFLLFTISSFNISNAQEKQNDATWEETVEFLKNNIKYLNYNEDNTWQYDYSIKDNNLIHIKEFDINDNMRLIHLYDYALEDIKSVSLIGDYQINLIALGDVFQWHRQYIKGEPRVIIYESKGYLRFDYSNPSTKKMGERITKALKQIAYYNDKRKKQSKF